MPENNPPPQELLAQCGHYSEKVRRDGLVGMDELLSKHPAELRRHAGPIVERLAERITDTAPGALSATPWHLSPGLPGKCSGVLAGLRT